MNRKTDGSRRPICKRIYELKIPPAWTEVAINPAAKGRLQAIGKDTAGRWQYLYHENHTRTQELRKFQTANKVCASNSKDARHRSASFDASRV